AEWFIRGIPRLENILPEDPAPSTCNPSISPEVTHHINRMRTMGWGQRAREMGMLMFGCGPDATSPRDCLGSEPSASDTAYGASWNVVPGASMRILYETNYRSSYWTRSSPDGRFVAHGANVPGANRARFIDLHRDVAIPARALYDPSFFPDGSAFMFQGMGALTCPMGILLAEPTSITFSEPGCTRSTALGLYQHVGASLDGADHWALFGPFQSDDGGHMPTLNNPPAMFGSDSVTRFMRLVNTGSGFVPMGTASIRTPFEGDSVLAPSGELFVNRLAGRGGRQLGYVLRRIIIERSGGSWSVRAPEVARYCTVGGKPSFDFDERYLVFHRYVTNTNEDAMELGFSGTEDPGFLPYRTQGAANLYLLDLLTGSLRRLTQMGPGQYALFPHFRADGWIFFIVRSAGTSVEYVVATDAMLLVRDGG
ncbi:MAG: hypothetical protein N2515_07210, partial [Deltaproteobacteria bacterium]|nr:hypothetical protein [Deltaproteobacteria bacterium]